MDPLDTYRQCIDKVLRDYAQLPYAYGEVETEVVSDRHGDHYLLLAVGWDGAQRVHGSNVPIDIINGKVWIQRDGTEHGLAEGLVAAGIPRDCVSLSPSRPQAIHRLRCSLSHTRCDALDPVSGGRAGTCYSKIPTRIRTRSSTSSGKV